MAKSELETIFERRRVLQNPYAYLEHLDARPHTVLNTLARKISSSRRLLQNPYAHLEELSGFSTQLDGNSSGRALRQPRAISSDDEVLAPLTDANIEARISQLHRLIWRERTSLWPNSVPRDPVEMLDPSLALRLFGYEFQLEEVLGQYHSTSGLIEVAGLIDRASKVVRVSSQFPVNVRTFTAAHELGHAVLHPSVGGVHRDRPLDGVSLSRERSEIEADKFATLFLMPAKLVRSRFIEIFQEAPFVLNEETSFALTGISHSKLLKGCKTRRDLSRLLASAKQYNGRNFASLATQFHVSTEAMAIRLEELALLSY